VTSTEDLLRDYRTVLLRYLSRRDEVVLADGYALGRRALADGVSLIELVQVHHTVIAELAGTDLAGTSDTMLAASELLVEALASYEMERRIGRTTAG
jgi:hypothetical protein